MLERSGVRSCSLAFEGTELRLRRSLSRPHSLSWAGRSNEVSISVSGMLEYMLDSQVVQLAAGLEDKFLSGISQPG